MKDKLVGYTLFIFSLLIFAAWAVFTIWGIVDWNNGINAFISQQGTIALIVVPVGLGMFIFFIIAAWIGWTIATTPPPAPIDLEDFENLEKSNDEK